MWNPLSVLPESRQQLDQNAEGIGRSCRQERAGLGTLEEQRPTLVVMPEQPHRAVAVPALERSRLLLVLPMSVVELEHRERPVRKLDAEHDAVGARWIRLAEREIPLLREGLDRHPATLWRVLGVWRSLVARSVRVGEVPSSNLGTPIVESREVSATRFRFGHGPVTAARLASNGVPRPPRDQSAGIRHVICRGNRRQTIFVDDKDRHRYLGSGLEEACGNLGWRVLT